MPGIPRIESEEGDEAGGASTGGLEAETSKLAEKGGTQAKALRGS